MICLVEILERKNTEFRGRGWKKCRQTEEKAREVTLKFCKILLKMTCMNFLYDNIIFKREIWFSIDFVLCIFSYLQLHAEKEGVFTEYR